MAKSERFKKVYTQGKVNIIPVISPIKQLTTADMKCIIIRRLIDYEEGLIQIYLTNGKGLLI